MSLALCVGSSHSPLFVWFNCQIVRVGGTLCFSLRGSFTVRVNFSTSSELSSHLNPTLVFSMIKVIIMIDGVYSEFNTFNVL